MSLNINTTGQLIPPRFLFRIQAPLLRYAKHYSGNEFALSERHRLLDLSALDDSRTFAEIRGGYNGTGLFFQVLVTGKRQPVWCRDSRLEDSDSAQFWIDTRDTHNIHRASRFCHRYVFMPAGAGRDYVEPVADQLLINRARENARPVRPRELQVHSRITKTGYSLSAYIPLHALEGFDPVEHPKLGFNYAVYDRELGLQTFSVGSRFPFEEDPSLWATLVCS